MIPPPRDSKKCSCTTRSSTRRKSANSSRLPSSSPPNLGDTTSRHHRTKANTATAPSDNHSRFNMSSRIRRNKSRAVSESLAFHPSTAPSSITSNCTHQACNSRPSVMFPSSIHFRNTSPSTASTCSSPTPSPALATRTSKPAASISTGLRMSTLSRSSPPPAAATSAAVSGSSSSPCQSFGA